MSRFAATALAAVTYWKDTDGAYSDIAETDRDGFVGKLAALARIDEDTADAMVSMMEAKGAATLDIQATPEGFDLSVEWARNDPSAGEEPIGEDTDAAESDPTAAWWGIEEIYGDGGDLTGLLVNRLTSSNHGAFGLVAALVKDTGGTIDDYIRYARALPVFGPFTPEQHLGAIRALIPLAYRANLVSGGTAATVAFAVIWHHAQRALGLGDTYAGPNDRTGAIAQGRAYCAKYPAPYVPDGADPATDIAHLAAVVAAAFADGNPAIAQFAAATWVAAVNRAAGILARG